MLTKLSVNSCSGWNVAMRRSLGSDSIWGGKIAAEWWFSCGCVFWKEDEG